MDFKFLNMPLSLVVRNILEKTGGRAGSKAECQLKGRSGVQRPGAGDGRQLSRASVERLSFTTFKAHLQSETSYLGFVIFSARIMRLRIKLFTLKFMTFTPADTCKSAGRKTLLRSTLLCVFEIISQSHFCCSTSKNSCKNPSL